LRKAQQPNNAEVEVPGDGPSRFLPPIAISREIIFQSSGIKLLLNGLFPYVRVRQECAGRFFRKLGDNHSCNGTRLWLTRLLSALRGA
jgi:hypothetical protein